jgi:phage shock protein PspC (stress-responsive transcriptional regulator)
MTSEPNNRPSSGIRRSRSDRVLGGVCAGIARSMGVDPVLVRIAAVLLALLSGGTAVVAYLLAWVLIPPAADQPQAPSERHEKVPRAGSAKEAWTAVGGELQSLAAQVRQPSRPDSGEEGGKRPDESSRAPLHTVDAKLTELGDRLRTPQVREGARRTISGLSAAVEASVDELGNRARRTRSAPDAETAPPPRQRDE